MSGEVSMANPARIVIRRSVSWADTDASGHYQFQTVFRWVQEAEGEMHVRLGIAGETQGSSPRIHVDADYLDRLWFADEVEIELRVDHLGTTSLRYGFEVRKKEGQPAARGAMVVAYLPRNAERPLPWPDHLRSRFAEGGLQT